MLSLSLTWYLCIFLDLFYPTYASFKALATATPDDDIQWLTWWIVRAFITTAEAISQPVLNWVPLYYEMKFLLILWMVAPQTQGAKVVFAKVIRPFLVKYASKIDPVFQSTHSALNSQYTGVAAGLVERYGPTAAEQAANIIVGQASQLQAVAAKQMAAAAALQQAEHPGVPAAATARPHYA